MNCMEVELAKTAEIEEDERETAMLPCSGPPGEGWRHTLLTDIAKADDVVAVDGRVTALAERLSERRDPPDVIGPEIATFSPVSNTWAIDPEYSSYHTSGDRIFLPRLAPVGAVGLWMFSVGAGGNDIASVFIPWGGSGSRVLSLGSGSAHFAISSLYSGTEARVGYAVGVAGTTTGLTISDYMIAAHVPNV